MNWLNIIKQELPRQETHKMIHLFNKTYLDIDAFIDDSQDRIVISAQNGFPMLGRPEPLQYGWLHAYGTSFDEVVGAGKTFSSIFDMFQFCLDKNISDNRRVIIYCDKETFMTISSLWFKTIFKSIDAEHSYKFVKSAFARSVIIGAKSNARIQATYLAQIPTMSEFSTAFAGASTEASSEEFLASIANFKSLEFLLSSYLVDGSYKEQLKTVYRLMINRTVETMMLDAWKCIRYNALQTEFQSTVGISHYTIDNILDLLSDPGVAGLVNALPYTLPSTEGVKSSLDLTTISDTEFNELKSKVELILSYPSGDMGPIFSKFTQYFNTARKAEFTDSDLESAIALELLNSEGVRLWSLKDRDNINIYFIDHVFEAKKANQTSTLTPYLLK